MGKPVIGEIVVLPFPPTDLQVGKRRPALVVADLSGDDLILCQITTQSRHDPYSVPLGMSDLESGRLNVDSFIRPNRLFTVDYGDYLQCVRRSELPNWMKLARRFANCSVEPKAAKG
jgi:mRNA-degrading endonuclease toxin of MazEF toxin-antitoxin module